METTMRQDAGLKEGQFYHLDGKCLLKNWVEERAVEHIDDDEEVIKKLGHKGILTLDYDAKVSDVTTVRESYKKPVGLGISVEGKRRETLTRLLYEKISKDLENQFHPPPEPVLYESVMMADFGGRGKSLVDDVNPLRGIEVYKVTDKPDTFYNEQPVTFWSEHKGKITGTTQTKTGDTPFRKNTSFSKPIDEYWDETQPYDIENYPKM